MAKTDATLLTQAQTITNESVARANTAARVGGTLEDLVTEKLNVDKIDVDGTLAGNLDTKVASQKAVKTYVDLRELLSNKSTNLTTDIASNTKYSTPASIATYVATQVAKVYAVTLAQSSSAAPVATDFKNTTGGTVAYSRTSAGLYVGTITGATFPTATAFLPVKILFRAGATTDVTEITFAFTSTTTFQITTKTGPLGSLVSTDSILNGDPLEIRIY